MRIEDLEEAISLKNKRERLLGIINSDAFNQDRVTIIYDKHKPLSVFNQVTVDNLDCIRVLVNIELRRIETNLERIGVDY